MTRKLNPGEVPVLAEWLEFEHGYCRLCSKNALCEEQRELAHKNRPDDGRLACTRYKSAALDGWRAL